LSYTRRGENFSTKSVKKRKNLIQNSFVVDLKNVSLQKKSRGTRLITAAGSF